MDLAKARLAEIEKYRAVYAKYPTYRMMPVRREPVVDKLRGLSGSLLDVSCGRGELMESARELGFSPVLGTEAVSELCGDNVTYAVITELPFDDKQFDVVTCIDVLEHLLEPDIVPGLLELQRVVRRTLLLSAATYSTILDGVELHPSARPAREWERLLKATLSGEVKYEGTARTSHLWKVTYEQ
jgi:2-polyprenyl-3-methyl-5-hydroxy-6-metoxy-1,4-benzoquinol methylase